RDLEFEAHPLAPASRRNFQQRWRAAGSDHQLARAFVHPQADFARAVGWGRLSCISRADNTGREFYPRIQNHELLVFLRCRSLILGVVRLFALAGSEVCNYFAALTFPFLRFSRRCYRRVSDYTKRPHFSKYVTQ